MATYYANKAIEILRQDGPVELSKRSTNYVRRSSYLHLYHKPMMRVKYGQIRPLPKKVLIIEPTLIDYRIANRYLPDNRPPYGIIEGNWDLKKTHWKNDGIYHHVDDRIFYGLIERFEMGKKWENTVYYKTGMEFLESGEPFLPLGRSGTKEDFRRNLDHIDNLYEDIKNNGYKMSSIITTHIGRDGEFIVDHGQHRLTIARITGVEEVPVRIQYRHKQWQELRGKIYNNCLTEEVDDLSDHPDLQDILD